MSDVETPSRPASIRSTRRPKVNHRSREGSETGWEKRAEFAPHRGAKRCNLPKETDRPSPSRINLKIQIEKSKDQFSGGRSGTELREHARPLRHEEDVMHDEGASSPARQRC